MGFYYGYRPYVPVAKRRANGLKEAKRLAKKGRALAPVNIPGKSIADTFWGKAWCDNLESYSDFSNRLPRGRSYVRNGSVVDLQIAAGKITALVSGSELYEVTIKIKPLAVTVWSAVKTCCAGEIGSLVELLQGKLSKGVMEIVTNRDKGLFPAPREIEMSCSCPDWAGVCKHVAAVMYGIGNRLDHQPELLFALRAVDHLELIAQAGDASLIAKSASGKTKKTVAEHELADVFGIELDVATVPIAVEIPARKTKISPAKKKSTAKKKVATKLKTKAAKK